MPIDEERTMDRVVVRVPEDMVLDVKQIENKLEIEFKPYIPPEPPPDRDVIWTSFDEENWNYSARALEPYHIQRVKVQGQDAQKFTLDTSEGAQANKHRAELEAKGNAVISYGQECQFTHSLWLRDYSDLRFTNKNDYTVVYQMHDGEGGGSPTYLIEIGKNHNLRARLRHKNSDQGQLFELVPKLEPDKVVELETKIYYHQNKGYIKIWVDGVQQVNFTGGVGTPSHKAKFKQGFYTGKPEVDDFRDNIGKWFLYYGETKFYEMESQSV